MSEQTLTTEQLLVMHSFFFAVLRHVFIHSITIEFFLLELIRISVFLFFILFFSFLPFHVLFFSALFSPMGFFLRHIVLDCLDLRYCWLMAIRLLEGNFFVSVLKAICFASLHFALPLYSMCLKPIVHYMTCSNECTR